MAAAGGDDVEFDPNDPDAEKLPEEQKGIIMAMIKQLKPGNGMDLSRITLPTFILEPRSLLERFTDFLCHAQYIIPIHSEADPLQRFLSVARWFISGYHIRPTGVKKPYNPILGECCRAEWDHGEQGRTLFIAEQTSHHPPVSAFYFVNPRCNLVVEGNVKPKSRFLLNSVASLMEGSMFIRLLNLDEEYVRPLLPSLKN